MNDSSPYHAYVDSLLRQSIPGDLFFDEMILVEPVEFSVGERARRHATRGVISELFSKSREIFHRCIFDGAEAVLRRLLLNDSIERLPLRFYHNLPQEVWTDPLFVRTDESRAGKIFEIQCPGSGWGDLLLLTSLYRDHCKNPNVISFTPGAEIIKAIQEICGTESPSVLHLLDNSSNPSSMHFLIRSTQPPLRYWGCSKDVRCGECNLVRSHSVYGLIAENLFFLRLKRAAEGTLKFDLPPLLIFDQKMILCLPFLDQTKAEFSDAVRETIAYTYPVTSTGFRDVTGEWTTLEAFLARPPRGRKYFLKYGGCDTTVNWGSRAVFRLDSEKASELLKVAVADYDNGRPWVIQPALAEKEWVSYFPRQSAEPKTERLTAKYSTFYGPDGPVGVRSQYRMNTKVHGQVDAVVGLAF